jgi:hypothetical protein
MDIQDLPRRSPGAIVSSQMHFLFSFRNVLAVSRAKNFVCMTDVKGIFGPYRVIAIALGFASGSNLTPRAKNAYFTPLIHK